MGCLLEQFPEGHQGSVQCEEAGCTLRRFTSTGEGWDDAETVNSDCVQPIDIFQKNKEVIEQEAELAFGILQANRHRSVEPYEWFGPDAEPCPPGKDCKCLGCDARFAF